MTLTAQPCDFLFLLTRRLESSRPGSLRAHAGVCYLQPYYIEFTRPHLERITQHCQDPW